MQVHLVQVASPSSGERLRNEQGGGAAAHEAPNISNRLRLVECPCCGCSPGPKPQNSNKGAYWNPSGREPPSIGAPTQNAAHACPLPPARSGLEPRSHEQPALRPKVWQEDFPANRGCHPVATKTATARGTGRRPNLPAAAATAAATLSARARRSSADRMTAWRQIVLRRVDPPGPGMLAFGARSRERRRREPPR